LLKCLIFAIPDACSDLDPPPGAIPLLYLRIGQIYPCGPLGEGQPQVDSAASLRPSARGLPAVPAPAQWRGIRGRGASSGVRELGAAWVRVEGKAGTGRRCWLCLGTHTHTNARWNKNTVDFPVMNATATNSPVSWLFSLFTRLDNFAERNTWATYRPLTHQDLHAMIHMTRSVISRASSLLGHHCFSMRTGNYAHHSLSQNRHAHPTHS
jgi:hypothetical protein